MKVRVTVAANDGRMVTFDAVVRNQGDRKAAVDAAVGLFYARHGDLDWRTSIITVTAR